MIQNKQMEKPLHDEVMILLSQMFMFNPALRLSMSEICTNPWVCVPTEPPLSKRETANTEPFDFNTQEESSYREKEESLHWEIVYEIQEEDYDMGS